MGNSIPRKLSPHIDHLGEVNGLNCACLSTLLILILVVTITTSSLGDRATLETIPDRSATQVPRITVAASGSSAATGASTDYLCDGVNDHVEIQAALDTLPETGGEVVLTEGIFQCTKSVVIPPKSALIGQGAGETTIELNNSILHLKHEGTSLQNLSVSGYQYDWRHRWDAPVFITASDVSVHAVIGTADNTIHAVFFVASLDTTDDSKVIENIEFSGCKAVDPGTSGFMLSASQAATNKLIRNITFIDCEAINCGRYSRFDPWVAGFDFAEQNDIENLQVIRCRAEGNWESGFHVESSPNKINVVMIDCISNENAQKDKTGMAHASFGAGYLVNGDMRLINCTSEENYVGFYCSGGGFEVINCTDRASQFGYALNNLTDPKGTHLISCKATGELNPIYFGRGDMIDVMLDSLTISSDTGSGEKAGITITRDVRNAPEILVQDSRIQGYRYGINNIAAGAVWVKNVEVSGAVVDFINCEILDGPDPVPIASMLPPRYFHPITYTSDSGTWSPTSPSNFPLPPIS